MSKQNITFSAAIILFVALATIFLYFNSVKYSGGETLSDKSVDQANSSETVLQEQIAYGKNLYEQYKAAGGNFANGPCLSNGRDWVIDVAHNPRQPVDNDPNYQCPAYVSGQAKHFVELDIDGNLIRAE